MEIKTHIYPYIRSALQAALDKIPNDASIAIFNSSDKSDIYTILSNISEYIARINNILTAGSLDNVCSDIVINFTNYLDLIGRVWINELGGSFLPAVKIANILESNSNIEDDVVLHSDMFKLIEVDLEVNNISAYGYYNLSDISKSILYLNLDRDDWPHQLNTNKDLLCVLFDNIKHIDKKLLKSKIMLVSTNIDISCNSAQGCLKAHLLGSGYKIHETVTITRTPNVRFCFEAFDPSHPYQQFNDIYVIYSEYLDRDELLIKYLSLYHIIENFMVKMPIVDLETKYHGKMFSIRDFKNMDLVIEKNELPMLINFINKSYDHVCCGTKIIDTARNKFNALETDVNFNKNEFNDLLVQYSFNKFDYDILKSNIGDFKNFLPSFIYKLRNSIVHNKETEVHLSNVQLTRTLIVTFNTFIFEVLETLIFSLIASKNKLVWYDNSEIYLYDK